MAIKTKTCEAGSLPAVVDAINDAQTIAVCGHTRPDGDSVGSVLALCLALHSMGKRPVPVLADNEPAPELYSFLPNFKGFMEPSELIGEKFDLFIAVDTPIVSRLAEAQELFVIAKKRAVVDHHPVAMPYGDAFYSRPCSAAVGQLIWELIDMLGVERTGQMATCCYTAIVTDTGRFQFQNTSASVLRAAAEMVDAGAYPSEIASAVYQSRTYCSLALRARVMKRLKLINNDLVAYSWVTQQDLEDTGANLDDYEGMPDLVRSVRGIEVAIMLKADNDGTVRGNLRAKGEFDVGEVAVALGGGGHAAAAGFTVENSSVEETLARLLPMLPGYDEGGRNRPHRPHGRRQHPPHPGHPDRPHRGTR